LLRGDGASAQTAPGWGGKSRARVRRKLASDERAAADQGGHRGDRRGAGRGGADRARRPVRKRPPEDLADRGAGVELALVVVDQQGGERRRRRHLVAAERLGLAAGQQVLLLAAADDGEPAVGELGRHRRVALLVELGGGAAQRPPRRVDGEDDGGPDPRHDRALPLLREGDVEADRHDHRPAVRAGAGQQVALRRHPHVGEGGARGRGPERVECGEHLAVGIAQGHHAAVGGERGDRGAVLVGEDCSDTGTDPSSRHPQLAGRRHARPGEQRPDLAEDEEEDAEDRQDDGEPPRRDHPARRAVEHQAPARRAQRAAAGRGAAGRRAT